MGENVILHLNVFDLKNHVIANVFYTLTNC